MKKFAFVFALLTSAAFAQTYTAQKPFTCDLASRYPVFSFSQFACRGEVGVDPAGATLDTYFWGSGRIELFGPFNIGPYTSSLTETNFTQPAPGQPGTYAFNWQGVDSNGTPHSGSASGTWVNQLVCGGRGCQWYAPKLLTFSNTVNF